MSSLSTKKTKKMIHIENLIVFDAVELSFGSLLDLKNESQGVKSAIDLLENEKNCKGTLNSGERFTFFRDGVIVAVLQTLSKDIYGVAKSDEDVVQNASCFYDHVRSNDLIDVSDYFDESEMVLI